MRWRVAAAATLVIIAALAWQLSRRPRCRHLCISPHPTQLERISGRLGGPGHIDGPIAVAHLNAPWGLACAGTRVYFTEDGSNAIRLLDLASGQLSTLAGSVRESGADDGIGDAARFYGPAGLAIHDGLVYIADTEHHLLRTLDPQTGRVQRLGGDPGKAGHTDGPLASALFNEPEGIAFDSNNLYVGDTDNQLIRKIALDTRQVSTVAGALFLRGKTDGPGASARFSKPMSLAGDEKGHIYIADTGNNSIRILHTSDNSVSTLAQLPTLPFNIAWVDGALLVSLANHEIVRIDAQSGALTTWAGAANQPGFVDGPTGNEGAARLERPSGICALFDGRVIVADSGNHALRVRQHDALTTLVGAASAGSSDGDSQAARFRAPLGAAFRNGSFYVADTANQTVRVVDAQGNVHTLAGAAGQVGHADGVGKDARFATPQSLALDDSGHLFVADGANRLIRAIDIASGRVTTLGLHPIGLIGPGDVTFADGALFVADHDGHTILRVDPVTGLDQLVAGKQLTAGKLDGRGAQARFCYPQGLSADGLGHLFVADERNDAIRKIDLATSQVTTLPLPQLHFVAELAADGAGDLFVIDPSNSAIRKIDLATNNVSLLVGAPQPAGVALGPLPAQIDHPTALVLTDAGGVAFFAENTLLEAE